MPSLPVVLLLRLLDQRRELSRFSGNRRRNAAWATDGARIKAIYFTVGLAEGTETIIAFAVN